LPLVLSNIALGWHVIGAIDSETERQEGVECKMMVLLTANLYHIAHALLTYVMTVDRTE